MRAACLAAAAALVLAAEVASAHSLLLDSDPGAGSVVSAPPARLSLRFNNRIEKRLSHVRLLGPGHDARELPVAPEDGSADRVTAAAPPLTPGLYRVEWQVLSTDGHVVRGRFSFEVRP
jgi:methionine-rich copper-binding protein CopC